MDLPTTLLYRTAKGAERVFGKGANLSLPGAEGDEAISFSGKDCFAEFILSIVEGLALTRFLTSHVEGEVEGSPNGYHQETVSDTLEEFSR